MSSAAIALLPTPPAAPQTLPSAATSAFIKPCKAKQQEIPTEVERKTLNTLDNFTCHICLDKFSTVGDKKPSNLPCGHTFCQQCLLNGKLSKCPSCRSKIPFFSDINKPPTNFPIISIIENLSTKRELIPELQYSFAQRILIHELAKAQDYVTELKIELKFSEIENQDKAEESVEAKEDIKKLEVRIQEAEEKVLKKRLELSNAICKTPNYLLKVKECLDKEIKNPFAFNAQTFVPSSSSSFSCSTFSNSLDKDIVKFDFESSNVPLTLIPINSNMIRKEKKEEEDLKSNLEIERAIDATRAAMNWKDYEKHIQGVKTSRENITGIVIVCDEAMNSVGSSEPIVSADITTRRRLKVKKNKKKGNLSVPEDVLAKFDGSFVPPLAFEECLSVSCVGPFTWLWNLFIQGDQDAEFSFPSPKRGSRR